MYGCKAKPDPNLCEKFGLESNDGRRPGQAGTEGDQSDNVTGLNTAAFQRFIQGNGNTGGRGVAKAIHIDINLAGINFKTLANGFNDANVRLMGDQQAEGVRSDFSQLQRFMKGRRSSRPRRDETLHVLPM